MRLDARIWNNNAWSSVMLRAFFFGLVLRTGGIRYIVVLASCVWGGRG